VFTMGITPAIMSNTKSIMVSATIGTAIMVTGIMVTVIVREVGVWGGDSLRFS
jgi:hypothetical protein